MLPSSSGSVVVRTCRLALSQARGLFKPPSNTPYRGIYRTDGETVRRDELLVCQKRLNYHPGLNVYAENDRQLSLLKADCDGVVKISREKIEPNFGLLEVRQEYEHKENVEIYKLTFNVIPLEMSQSYNLVNEV